MNLKNEILFYIMKKIETYQCNERKQCYQVLAWLTPLDKQSLATSQYLLFSLLVPDHKLVPCHYFNTNLLLQYLLRVNPFHAGFYF
jgi:hypothetical protein